MSKIFLHVGLHKTASTFLQRKIFPYFKNVSCITRPYTQQSLIFNKLQYADDTVFNLQEFKLEFQEISNRNNTTIISDELLSGIPECNYINRSLITKRLSNLFPKAEIILFLRGQKDILLSMYNQYIKMGGTEPINNYIWFPQEEYNYKMYCSQEKHNYWRKKTRYFNHLSKNIHLTHFLYHDLIKLYKDRFPRVHVLLYEDFIHNPQKVILQIQEIINQPLEINEEETFTKKENKKLAENKVTITRYQNIVKPIIKSSNKYSLRLLALYYKYLVEQKKSNITSNYSEYIDKVIDGFYRDDNLKIIADYPAINLQNHPQAYQF